MFSRRPLFRLKLVFSVFFVYVVVAMDEKRKKKLVERLVWLEMSVIYIWSLI